jgi:hypothetical protein
LAGDDVFALLTCDEDLEYGARHRHRFVGRIKKKISLGEKASYDWLTCVTFGESNCHGLLFSGIKVVTQRLKIRLQSL